MKLAGMLGIAFLLVGTMVVGFASAGIEGSKHDFSHEAWSQDNVCGACHIPHRTNAPKAAPLWNPSADLTTRFGIRVGKDATAGSGTLACLRCHDGTIARDIAPAAADGPDRDPLSLLTTNIHGASEHPVGVIYPRMDRGFRPGSALAAEGLVKLPAGRVECVSCHDPHDTAGTKHMLVKDNSRSRLCLTCHKK